MLNDRTVRAVMVVIVIFVILGLLFSSIQFAL